MKIALITPNFPPENGACSSRIYYMAKGLVSAGNRVEVITALPNYPTGKIFPAYRSAFSYPEVVEGIPVWRYRMYPSNSPRLLPRILSMISLSLSVLLALPTLRRLKPDLVIVQSPPLLLALSAWLLSRLCGAGFVLNVSDLWPRALLDLGALRKGWVYRQLARLENFLYRKALFCMGQSEEIIRHVKKRYPQVDTLLYRTGVDCRLFYPTPLEPAPEGTTLRLVYAGLLGVAQGILDLCKQVDFKLLGVEFHIYGDGYERQAIAEYLYHHPDRNIFLHAPVTYSEVPAVLRQYDGALIAQKGRLFGTVPSKIYEAMSTGLPVLLMGSGESAEIVTRFCAGLVSPPADYAALCNNIGALQKMSAAERLALKNNGTQAALQYFDRKHLLQQLLEKLKTRFL